MRPETRVADRVTSRAKARPHAPIEGAREAREAGGPLALVVEGKAGRNSLKGTLSANGLRAMAAHSGAEAIQLAVEHSPDLVLLEFGLPGIDGIQVTRRLREWMSAPIFVFSAGASENDKIVALDAGANDYLTKPVGVGELLARIRVWLRQAASQRSASNAVIELGELRMDFGRHLVFVRGEEVHLTQTEYSFLGLLVRNANRVMTHRQILEVVWDASRVHDMQYLRVYMRQLRQKIERDPSQPRYLLTEPGLGYRFRAA